MMFGHDVVYDENDPFFIGNFREIGSFVMEICS